MKTVIGLLSKIVGPHIEVILFKTFCKKRYHYVTSYKINGLRNHQDVIPWTIISGTKREQKWTKQVKHPFWKQEGIDFQYKVRLEKMCHEYQKNPENNDRISWQNLCNERVRRFFHQNAIRINTFYYFIFTFATVFIISMIFYFSLQKHFVFWCLFFSFCTHRLY